MHQRSVGHPSDMNGAILWFTGLSGAGKSTLSQAVAEKISGIRPVQILDADEIRPHLSKGLGYSKDDRNENVRRIAFVSRLLARHGVVVIAAVISPYAETRNEIRQLAAAEGIRFVEVFVDAPLQALIERDVKGLYKKALAGMLPNFTGVSDPYERPENPDVTVRTDIETLNASLVTVLEALTVRKIIPESVLV
jgi:adenylylsulfate kinase